MAEMIAVELPEPSEYTPSSEPMWNIYPFVRVEGDEIKLGATCEYLYTICEAEARGVAAALLAAANRVSAAKT